MITISAIDIKVHHFIRGNGMILDMVFFFKGIMVYEFCVMFCVKFILVLWFFALAFMILLYSRSVPCVSQLVLLYALCKCQIHRITLLSRAYVNFKPNESCMLKYKLTINENTRVPTSCWPVFSWADSIRDCKCLS